MVLVVRPVWMLLMLMLWRVSNSNAIEMVVVHVCSCFSDLHEFFMPHTFELKAAISS